MPADRIPDAHPADETIRAARRAASRLSRAREEVTIEGLGRRWAESNRHESTPPHGPGRRRAEGDRHVAGRSIRRHAGDRRSRHAAAPRGRHAMPPDPLSITVRPLPAPDAVRGGAPAIGERPPVIGSRRAPGTLPIESWLLVGKGRQQALLAAVVAAGLALVMIPAAQRGGDEVNPVNAAGTAAAVTEPAREPAAEPPAAGGKPAQQDRPAESEAKETTPAKPADAAPVSPAAPPASAVPETPAVVVPAGDGPFRSWKTTGSSTVALTFDDGPDPVQTPRILAMLAEYDVKATFCLVGAQVERHPEIVGQIVAAGHTLCNHTWDHSLTIGRESPAVIDADLARTSQAIHRAVPGVEIPFFRAPGGIFTDRLVQTAYRAGMTSLYWEVDPRDWEHAKEADDEAHVEKIVTEVRRSVRPGAIVLSHDFNQPATVTAYERLLPWLSANFALGVPSVPAPPADS